MSIVRKWHSYPEYYDSGVQWLGAMPLHWRVARIKSVVTLKNNRVNEWSDQDNYVGLENIESWTGRLIYLEQLSPLENDENTKSVSNVFQAGDVLFGKLRPYLAKAFLATSNGVCTSELLVMTPLQDTNGRFLLYTLLTKGFIELVNSSTYGAKMPRANWDMIGNITIPVPPLYEQHTIAAFLDTETTRIDNLIFKKRRLLNLITERRQAIITHAVTTGLKADAPMKDSGVEWLGEIPEHWIIIQLRQALASFEYGISTNLSGEGQYKVLTMGHIVNGRLTIPDEGCLEEEPEIILEHHDLVFNRTNSLEHVGKVGIFEGQKEDKISIASYLVRLRSNDRALPVYLNYLLNSNWMLAEARSRALPSINQANLNPSRYTSIPIPLPPVIEQMEIVTYLDQQIAKLDRLQDKAQAAIDRLQERRKALISEAVTGKIRVTE